MSIISCSISESRFPCVLSALRELCINFRENHEKAILVWTDSIKDIDYFSNLKPWQVINRIPCVNVLCRKASFTRLIQKISEIYPDLYSFVPKTFILPFKNQAFLKTLKKQEKTWIVKPDTGSLGNGITIIPPGFEYSPDDTLSVAQEYIPSFTIDNTKFDLRLYVLLKSIDPLQIYVYRDGLARFCSSEQGQHDIFSQITNVTLNKENPESEFDQISRLLSETFKKLEKQYLVDIKKLWEDIDNVIILSIISAYKILKKGVQNNCPPLIYNRCFQILGFDILLDNDMKPHVLEVNYRPSLLTHLGPERRMKMSMVRDAVSIACPLEIIQDIYLNRKYEWDDCTWTIFAGMNDKLTKNIDLQSAIATATGNFDLIYPSTNPDKQAIYEMVIDTVKSMPTDFLPGLIPEQTSSKM